MDIFDKFTVFQNDKKVYDKFLKETVPHSNGYFILAPSGAGKSHFIKRQKEKHWIDGDLLWIAAGAHPDIDWWTRGDEVIKEVDARSDIVTQTGKRLGLWIMGASNNWLLPDAAVLPPWEINMEYIRRRQEGNYDGGLKMDQMDQLREHREWIQSMAEQKNVPIFKSIEEATVYLEEI